MSLSTWAKDLSATLPQLPNFDEMAEADEYVQSEKFNVRKDRGNTSTTHPSTESKEAMKMTTPSTTTTPSTMSDGNSLPLPLPLPLGSILDMDDDNDSEMGQEEEGWDVPKKGDGNASLSSSTSSRSRSRFSTQFLSTSSRLTKTTNQCKSLPTQTQQQLKPITNPKPSNQMEAEISQEGESLLDADALEEYVEKEIRGAGGTGGALHWSSLLDHMGQEAKLPSSSTTTVTTSPSLLPPSSTTEPTNLKVVIAAAAAKKFEPLALVSRVLEHPDDEPLHAKLFPKQLEEEEEEQQNLLEKEPFFLPEELHYVSDEDSDDEEEPVHSHHGHGQTLSLSDLASSGASSSNDGGDSLLGLGAETDWMTSSNPAPSSPPPPLPNQKPQWVEIFGPKNHKDDHDHDGNGNDPDIETGVSLHQFLEGRHTQTKRKDETIKQQQQQQQQQQKHHNPPNWLTVPKGLSESFQKVSHSVMSEFTHKQSHSQSHGHAYHRGGSTKAVTEETTLPAHSTSTATNAATSTTKEEFTTISSTHILGQEDMEEWERLRAKSSTSTTYYTLQKAYEFFLLYDDYIFVIFTIVLMIYVYFKVGRW